MAAGLHRDLGGLVAVDLQQQRDGWVRELCATLVEWVTTDLQALPAVDPALGDCDLVAATLIARVAARAAAAESREELLAAVTASEVLVPGEDPEPLVDAVLARLSRSALPGPVPWDPSGTSRTLIEVWAAARSLTATRESLADELVRHWDVPDESALEYLLGLPPHPLAEYAPFLHSLPEGAAATSLLLHLSRGESVEGRLDSWWSTRLGAVAEAEHLTQLGHDLVMTNTLRRVLELSLEKHGSDAELRDVITAARELVDTAMKDLAEALDGLSITEALLLQPRPTDTPIRTSALQATVATGADVWTAPTMLGSELGLWGALPWFTIPVQGTPPPA